MQATTTDIGVSKSTANPSVAEVNAHAPTNTAMVRSQKRMPPTAILSIESIVAGTAVGKKIELHQRDRGATQRRIERQMEAFRLGRIGAAQGERSRHVRPQKRARGQHDPNHQRLLVAPEHRGDTNKCSPSPRVRKRWISSTKRRSRSRPVMSPDGAGRAASDRGAGSCTGALGIGCKQTKAA